MVANNDATVEFINGSSDVVIDSTYRQYILKGSNITADAKLKALGLTDDEIEAFRG